ncbi:MAG: hypothetical protein GC162_15250 [Planctomycetes bacterium]|nr:hypothetical protein [Planctomycetota bacterium]
MTQRTRLLMILALATAGLAAPALANVITVNAGTYDFSTATASAAGVSITGNDNWTRIGGTGIGTDDLVRSAGQPDANFVGNWLSGSGGDDLYTRANNGAFTYSVPATALTVSLAYTLRTNNATQVIFGVNTTGGILQFGTNATDDWWFREFNGTIHTLADGSGTPDDLTATLRTYRATLTVDVAAKTVSLSVANLSLGGSATVASGVALDSATFVNPSNWNGLFTRTRGAIDNFNISYTVQEIPTPAALPAGLLLLTLAAQRRWR